MTSAAKQRLQQLSEQLSVPPADPGTFENIPKIRRIAGDSASQRVKDKVVIVTGTNSPLGIGRASVHQFAHNGARAVYLCDYDDEFLPVHKRELESLYPGVDVHIRQMDAADEEAVKEVIGDALKRYGRLDVFFANAGRATASPFTEIGADDWMEMMRVNTLRYELH